MTKFLVLALVALLAIGGWLVVARPDIAGTALLVLNTPRDCSLGDAWSGAKRGYEISAGKEEWDRSARLLATEGNLQQWRGNAGDWWMPATSREHIGVVFAEMAANFYGNGANGVQPGDVVIDCGADIGVFTRQALNRGASKVISVEPFPDKEPSLRRNFAREIAQGRVVVVPKGVWNKDDVLKIYGDSLITKHAAQGFDVPLTTLDQIVAELRLEKVDHIKFDIEGAEPQALEGAQQTIRRFKPRIVLATEHTADDYIQLPNQIRSYVPEYTAACELCLSREGKLRPLSVRLDARR
jgi:FkbM family methyltransferase